MMRVPQFKDPDVTKFLTEMIRDFDRSDKDVMNSNTANKSLLLYAPDGSVWEIKVGNTGTLSATRPVKL